MNNSSDPMFDHYADMDFSTAKPVVEVPALAKLQADHGGKSRITMRVDTTTLAVFKARAEMCGGNYQTMMNVALRQYAEGLTDLLKETYGRPRYWELRRSRRHDKIRLVRTGCSGLNAAANDDRRLLRKRQTVPQRVAH
jgi:uncharacterized protein (DUF4415 family)